MGACTFVHYASDACYEIFQRGEKSSKIGQFIWESHVLLNFFPVVYICIYERIHKHTHRGRERCQIEINFSSQITRQLRCIFQWLCNIRVETSMANAIKVDMEWKAIIKWLHRRRSNQRHYIAPRTVEIIKLTRSKTLRRPRFFLHSLFKHHQRTPTVYELTENQVPDFLCFHSDEKSFVKKI